MKQQVVFIHGGEAFSDYNAFLEYLRNVPIDPYEEPSKRWHRTLSETLGEDFEVIRPAMPNAQNAKYLEWKIWFEKHIPFLRDGVSLIGHSQGGYFLAKYLAENEFPVRIKNLFLVAAAFEKSDFGGEDGGDFEFDVSEVHKLQDRAERIVIFHSKDDFVVPFSHGEKFAKALPKAQFKVFEDRNHFLQESFPELIEVIKGTQ